MEIETKVISTEIIKPSSPTPKSLQKHQLSLLDQALPPVFAPHVYFYSSNPQIPNSQKSNHLKKSLSEILSRFYPVAGRLVGNLYVDCNDGGVPFAEAEANCDLSQFITNPDTDKIKKLFVYRLDESQGFCFSVQATYFRCGGLALGLLLAHKIADALSYFTFINTWSIVARNGGGGGGGGCGSVPSPKFDVAAYFPPCDTSGVFTQEDVVTRNFTFPAARIATLQERYSSAACRRPSRVEALSAYIWTQYLHATGRQANPTKIYSVQNLVNVRSLVHPPMSENHFGNIVLITIAKPGGGGGDGGGAEFVQKVREAKKRVYDGSGAVEAKVMDVMNELTSQAEASERVVSFVFTSVCGFPLYEADFGWGKPVWSKSLGFPIKNVAIFTDTKCGGGIEALISFDKADLEKFEVSLDYGIIKSNL